MKITVFRAQNEKGFSKTVPEQSQNPPVALFNDLQPLFMQLLMPSKQGCIFWF